jgi:hypothetical protein
MRRNVSVLIRALLADATAILYMLGGYNEYRIRIYFM